MMPDWGKGEKKKVKQRPRAILLTAAWTKGMESIAPYNHITSSYQPPVPVRNLVGESEDLPDLHYFSPAQKHDNSDYIVGHELTCFKYFDPNAYKNNATLNAEIYDIFNLPLRSYAVA